MQLVKNIKEATQYLSSLRCSYVATLNSKQTPIKISTELIRDILLVDIIVPVFSSS